MEDYEIQNVETVTVSTVSQRRGGCCIHQTVMTTRLVQLVQTDQKLRDLVAAALRQIDDSNYDSVAEQVAAMEAVVAQFKQIVDGRVEKLEKEVAGLKRELERCRQDRWPSWAKTLGRTVVAVATGVLLSDGLRSKLRAVRNLLSLILDD